MIPARLAVSDRHHGYATEVAAETADGQVVLFPGSNPFRTLAEKQATAAEVVRRWNAFPALLAACEAFRLAMRRDPRPDLLTLVNLLHVVDAVMEEHTPVPVGG